MANIRFSMFCIIFFNDLHSGCDNTTTNIDIITKGKQCLLGRSSVEVIEFWFEIEDKIIRKTVLYGKIKSWLCLIDNLKNPDWHLAVPIKLPNKFRTNMQPTKKSVEQLNLTFTK